MKQFATFFVIGVINTAIDFFVYAGLTRLAGVYFALANIISVSVAILAGFMLHKQITFKNKEKSRWQFIRFVTVSLSSLVINTAVVVILVNILGVYDLIAKVVAAAFIVISSYLLQKNWVFATGNNGRN